MGKNLYIKGYIDLHKDEPLKMANLGEPDVALLAMFALVDVDICCPKIMEKPITFKEAMQRQIDAHGFKKLGLLVPLNYPRVLYNASLTKRYKNCLIHDCFHLISDEEKTQSTFLQIDIDKKTTLVIFGATDDTIAGWREDYIMCYGGHPRCLKYASEYAFSALQNSNRDYIFVGHSKGGMEALYAGLIQEQYQDKIKIIYDFDGQGVPLDIGKNFINNPYKNKVKLVIPQSSVVGRLFDTVVEPRITYSKEYGVLQHNPFSWAIDGKVFKTNKSGYEYSSEKLPNAINKMEKFWGAKRLKKFEEGLFRTLSAGGSFTMTDCIKHVPEIVKEFNKLPKTEKRMFLNILAYISDKNFASHQALLSNLYTKFKKREDLQFEDQDDTKVEK